MHRCLLDLLGLVRIVLQRVLLLLLWVKLLLLRLLLLLALLLLVGSMMLELFGQTLHRTITRRLGRGA